MDPISIGLITGVTLLSGYMGYNYYNSSTPVDNYEDEKDNIIEKVEQMKKNYNITYNDVINELNMLFELRNKSFDSSTDDSSSDLPEPFSESTTSEDLYMSSDSSEDK